MVPSEVQFDKAFRALTDHSPFRWQRRLFDQMRSGEIPRICDLPTGLGKTSVIPVWVIALASQAQTGSTTLPRRLIYIVNRRTVVDQATSVVEQIRQRLKAPDDSRWKEELETLAASLRRLVSTDESFESLLAVSTLRGELADNEQWKGDPARPGIIIGTIDMVGSKLLFSGYGDGRYWRAQHAGLVGQDSLIVHDEAHLTPAFSDLLHGLAEVQRQAHELRPVHVMELSATSRGGTGPILKLEPEDEADQVTGEVVRDRLDAAKSLHLHPLQVTPGSNRADVLRRTAEKLVELSMQHRDAQAKVLVYVQSPNAALRIIDLLKGQDANDRTALLTGTLRGYERDRLVREDPVYQALLDPNTPVGRTVYLVSTAAGEVGIDIDADHMVCDLTTLDSMIQRLGRVNRRGGQGRKARVDVVVNTEDANKTDKEDTLSGVTEALKETRAIFEQWVAQSAGALDASPRSLRTLLAELASDCREKAFAPKPTVPPLTDILLDSWSLTTISRPMPGRPEVAPYLHGISQDPPETHVAWRKEVTPLHKASVDQEVLTDWFQACRLEAHERLRDRTDRVQQALGALLAAHRRKTKDDGLDFPVVVLNEQGDVQMSKDNGETRWPRLSDITKREFNLRYRTVVLPIQAGGLNVEGTLDAKELDPASDVAEQFQDQRRRERWLTVDDEDGTQYERLISGKTVSAPPPDLKERERITLEQPVESAEGSRSRYLLLLAQPRQATLDHAETARTIQTLDFHLYLITEYMDQIANALGLKREIKEALIMAAKWHDRGKDRPIWQWYAYNDANSEPLAKSPKYRSGCFLEGYRHEFGSLLEAAANEEIRQHAESDLILHLIAAHHGWARPHFERNAWDNTRTTSDNEEAAAEVMRRFARLQERFGRWGLAWLESLVRCADIAASQPHDQSPTISSHLREVQL